MTWVWRHEQVIQRMPGWGRGLRMRPRRLRKVAARAAPSDTGLASVDTVETPPSFPRPRRYPRLELSAFVEVRRGDEPGAMVQLPVRNISRGGVLVGDAGVDLTVFAPGERLAITIVDASGDLDAAAHVEGHVVRHDAGGMALSWDHSDGGVRDVGAFLDRFYSKR
jgi:hypothetical protein